MRAREIEQYAGVLTGSEPVLVMGKVSFPQRSDDAEDEVDSPREPTILMSEVRPLAEAVRADTRASQSECEQIGPGRRISRAWLVRSRGPREVALWPST